MEKLDNYLRETSKSFIEERIARLENLGYSLNVIGDEGYMQFKFDTNCYLEIEHDDSGDYVSKYKIMYEENDDDFYHLSLFLTKEEIEILHEILEDPYWWIREE